MAAAGHEARRPLQRDQIWELSSARTYIKREPILATLLRRVSFPFPLLSFLTKNIVTRKPNRGGKKWRQRKNIQTGRQNNM